VPRWLMRPLARLMGETALGLSDLAVVEMPGLLGTSCPPSPPGGRGGRGVRGKQARPQNELSMFRYDP
jgi:hypothetical protein